MNNLFKVIEYLKESWQWIITLISGILLIKFPQIAQIFNWSIFNLYELCKIKWNVIVGICFIIVSTIFLFYHFFYLRKFCIIKVDGMNQQELKSLKSYNLFDISKQEFNLYRVNLDNDYRKQNIYKAFCEMKGMFEANISKGLYDKYLFYGYSYTPFLFLLGQMYSNNRNYYCFHMKQTNQKNKRIRLKRKSRDSNKLLDPIFNDNNSDILIIRVSTTVKIDKMDISQFGKVDTLDITSQINGTEVIDSVDRLDKWCELIVSSIRNTNLNKYSKINLLLATSSEMVFLLGKRLSKNSDPNFYVYHYDFNTNYKYPWALVSKKTDDFDEIVYIYKMTK